MSAHTPGPWAVWTEEKTRRDDVYIAGNPTGAPGGMRHLAYMVSTSDGDQTEANARLIAAAPDLLAALESALAMICEECADGECTEQAAAARAAIGKATGRAP